MGARIPEPIKIEVLNWWLEGLSRDKIAKLCEIGAGTVSSIIVEFLAADYSLPLQREVALKLKRENLSIVDLAYSIRLSKVLRNFQLAEEKLEAFMEQVEINCFKLGLSVEIFIDCVNEVCDFASNHHIPFDQLPRYIAERRQSLEVLDTEVEVATQKTIEALRNGNITLADIAEYQRERPTIEKYRMTKRELDKMTIRGNLENLRQEQVKKERDALDEKLARKEAYQFLNDLACSVTEDELTALEEKLGRPITSEEFSKTIDDVRQHPSRYAHVFRQAPQQPQSSN
jgi:23S rRNA pseudoU1915 N3-methylase RlmH